MNSKFEKYVLGFMFSPALDRVVLIQKQRPAWQRGKFNGVGGHIENGEEDRAAMVREYLEETGVTTIEDEWSKFCAIRGNHFSVECFCGVGDVGLVESMTDEQVAVQYTHTIEGCIHNLSWLIPLAIDHLKTGKQTTVTAHYP